MAKNAILFGGTDPGRFCPTYMIFCDSFIPHRQQPARDQTFDRRDVYIITQNALADGTYLQYIRAQYNRSTQVDPPFFQELFRSDAERIANSRTNLAARFVEPLDRFFETLGGRVEKRRRTYTSWFEPDDFLNLSALAAKLQAGAGQDALSAYLYEHLKPGTRDRLRSVEDTALRGFLARDLNELLELDSTPKGAPQTQSAQGASSPTTAQAESLYTPARFQSVLLSEYLQDFIAQNPQGNSRIRLNRLLLEAAYPGLIRNSPGGVYPDREIYTPTPEDSTRCFNQYAVDAQRRLQLNQLGPGEEVVRQGERMIQISGPTAVMAINGLLTKVIFDHNPKSEFFVEESFPLDWMYPYLSPYGIIMRINRQPPAELTEGVVATDHDFWSRYCDRLIGNWITYDTPVREIAAWSEQLYLRRNFKGFSGDRKFIRDDQAQKSFSKLRSSIAGLYNWRIAAAKPGSPERQRMIKEADFAFRQAYALCPYSPEALFRYVNLLLSPEVQRVDDALLLAKTSQKLDPFNTSFLDLIHRLNEWKAQRASLNPGRLEQELQQNPANIQGVLNLAGQYFQLGETGAALQALDRVLYGSNAPTALLRTLMPVYAAAASTTRLQQTVSMLVSQFRTNPANLEAAIGIAEGQRALNQPQPALQALDEVLNSPTADVNILSQAADQLVGLADYARLEVALEKMTRLAPDSPETWYDLAALRSIVGKPSQSLEALRQALKLSAARLAREPKARNLLRELERDPRFKAVRSLPEFRELQSGR
jgi:cytochrome c-type biogenesis protein CcmH/NrfG